MLFWLLLAAVLDVAAAACNFTQHLKQHDARAFEGYTLVAPGHEHPAGSRIYLIDMTGSVVHHWDPVSAHPGWNPGLHLQPDGILLRSGNEKGGGAQRFAWNGTIVWDYENFNMSHDSIHLPSGNILSPAIDVHTSEEVAAAGGSKPANRKCESIIEVRPTGPNSGEVVWQWNFWDHLAQNVDPAKPHYVADVGVVPGRMDVNADGSGKTQASADWCHMNAVDYNAELDQIIFSCRNLGEIFIIDHSTTTKEAATSSGGRSDMGGDILWRWGNPQNYNRGDSTDLQLVGQHDAHWVSSDIPGRSTGSEPANTVMVFNNMNRSAISPLRSTVDVLQLPTPNPSTGRYPSPSNGSFAPAAAAWSWGMDGFISYHLSGAQRLGNGNTHVTNGETGQLLEVTPDGKVVWEWYWNGTACAIPGELQWKGNCFFRTYRYPATYPGLHGHDLSRPVECPPNQEVFIV